MFPGQKEMCLSCNPAHSPAIILKEKDTFTTKENKRMNGMIRGWKVYLMSRDADNKH